MHDEKRAKEVHHHRQLMKDKWLRQRRYADLVQNLYRPKIDPKRRSSLELRKTTKVEPLSREELEEVKRRANEAMRVSKQEIPPHVRKKRVKPRPPSSAPSPRHNRRTPRPPPDYLAQLRRERLERMRKTAFSGETRPKQTNNSRRKSISSERTKELQEKARTLESIVKRKEMEAGGYTGEGTKPGLPITEASVNAATEVSELYLDVIKTKLALLNTTL